MKIFAKCCATAVFVFFIATGSIRAQVVDGADHLKQCYKKALITDLRAKTNISSEEMPDELFEVALRQSDEGELLFDLANSLADATYLGLPVSEQVETIYTTLQPKLPNFLAGMDDCKVKFQSTKKKSSANVSAVENPNEVTSETTGDWTVSERIKYNDSECLLASPSIYGSSVSFHYSIRHGGRQYALIVKDRERSFPETWDEVNATISFDSALSLIVHTSYIFAGEKYQLRDGQGVFFFKMREDFEAALRAVTMSKNIFFEYQEGFAETVVKVGQLGNALETFDDCVSRSK